MPPLDRWSDVLADTSVAMAELVADAAVRTACGRLVAATTPVMKLLRSRNEVTS